MCQRCHHHPWSRAVRIGATVVIACEMCLAALTGESQSSHPDMGAHVSAYMDVVGPAYAAVSGGSNTRLATGPYDWT